MVPVEKCATPSQMLLLDLQTVHDIRPAACHVEARVESGMKHLTYPSAKQILVMRFQSDCQNLAITLI